MRYEAIANDQAQRNCSPAVKFRESHLSTRRPFQAKRHLNRVSLKYDPQLRRKLQFDARCLQVFRAGGPSFRAVCERVGPLFAGSFLGRVEPTPRPARFRISNLDSLPEDVFYFVEDRGVGRVANTLFLRRCNGIFLQFAAKIVLGRFHTHMVSRRRRSLAPTNPRGQPGPEGNEMPLLVS